MTNPFQPAVRHKLYARFGLYGPGGSGKTWTALQISRGLAGPEGRIAVLDTEGGSASLYADLTPFDVAPLQPPYSPERYAKAIAYAAAEGYDVIIVDSLSHAWMGEGGVQSIVDAASGGNISGWKKGNPEHQRLLGAILNTPIHIIGTARSKNVYDTEKDERGKLKMTKIGLGPQQRDGLDYEFTVWCALDLEHNLLVEKSRSSAFPVGASIPAPGREVGEALLAWLNEGADMAPPAVPAEAVAPAEPVAQPAAPAKPAKAQKAAQPAEPTGDALVDAPLVFEAKLAMRRLRLADLRPDVDWSETLDQKCIQTYEKSLDQLDQAQRDEFLAKLDGTIAALAATAAEKETTA